MIKLNDKIGKYRLSKLLAEGGMAKVFEALYIEKGYSCELIFKQNGIHFEPFISLIMSLVIHFI